LIVAALNKMLVTKLWCELCMNCDAQWTRFSDII